MYSSCGRAEDRKRCRGRSGPEKFCDRWRTRPTPSRLLLPLLLLRKEDDDELSRRSMTVMVNDSKPQSEITVDTSCHDSSAVDVPSLENSFFLLFENRKFGVVFQCLYVQCTFTIQPGLRCQR